ncbi:MAG: hypothetical protein NC124_16805 [Clostridium sp.]|nr:hypothetical protein [Bacteroidales bacterium]MCM1207258.1 hypothetical protein [Bacillota bacterium]MCM1500125.1 hypothetical protein [Clostridium sp.]
MKTFCSLSTTHGWIIALMFIYAIPLYGMTQETSERIVDGIIEIKYTGNRSIGYDYTTEEIKTAYKLLLSKSKAMDYNTLLPEETKRMGMHQAVIKCRDHVQEEIFKRTNAKEYLAGKRIRLNFASLSDGSVVLSNIYSNENLINTIGTDGIKELISILQSYRFEQYNDHGKYHLRWFITIFIPKE